jgi:hypothetical protein
MTRNVRKQLNLKSLSSSHTASTMIDLQVLSSLPEMLEENSTAMLLHHPPIPFIATTPTLAPCLPPSLPPHTHKLHFPNQDQCTTNQRERSTLPESVGENQ